MTRCKCGFPGRLDTLELEWATVKPNSTGAVVLEPGATLGGHR